MFVMIPVLALWCENIMCNFSILQQVLPTWERLRFLERLFSAQSIWSGESTHRMARRIRRHIFCQRYASDPLSDEWWRGLITSFYCSSQILLSGAFIARSNHKFYDFHVVHIHFDVLDRCTASGYNFQCFWYSRLTEKSFCIAALCSVKKFLKIHVFASYSGLVQFSHDSRLCIFFIY